MSEDEVRGRAADVNVDGDEGGDAACWLRRVCPECGRLHAPDPPDVCEACGADLPD